jgi:guanylate kinase
VKINPNFKHKLVLFCGPSGSGKTTIVHSLLKAFPRMRFSISATTRPKRDNEVDGVDYYFLTPEQFRAKIANNEFLEWEEVYTDRYYGTLKADVQKILDDEYIALFDVDVEGGLAIRKNFGSQILDVFVMPPSVDELHKRLVARATETADSLSKRLEKAEKELHYAFRFNNVIVNIDLETSINDAKSLVQQFLDDVIPDPEEEN